MQGLSSKGRPPTCRPTCDGRSRGTTQAARVAVPSLSGYLDNVSVIATAALPADPLVALRELTTGQAELDELRRQTVARARSSGASWEQIAQVLGVSRQAAWEAFTRPARAAVAANAATNTQHGLTDDDATALAVAEARKVRRRRAG